MPEPRTLYVSSHAALGGSEAYLERVLERRPAASCAGVVCLADGPLVGRLRARGVPTAVVPTGPRAGLLPAAVRLARLVRRRRPQVVHANGVKAALVAALAPAGVPVVWVKHDFSFDGPLGRAVARRCAAVVAVSATVAEALGPAAEVVHNGVELPALDLAACRREATALAGGAPVLAVVGRLEPVKGQWQAVEALAQLRRTHPGARLLLVGAEDAHHPGYAERLRAHAAALGAADAVVLAGPREDAVALLAGSDVALVPTVRVGGRGGEGFGLVAVEAMAAGVPVVASDDGALPEVLGGCGRLVAPGDAAAIAAAVRELLDDEALRARLVACGRARAADAFTVDGMVDGLRAVLARAAGLDVRST